MLVRLTEEGGNWSLLYVLCRVFEFYFHKKFQVVRQLKPLLIAVRCEFLLWLWFLICEALPLCCVVCQPQRSILSWAVSLSLSAIAPPPSAYSPACKPQLTLGHSLAPGAQSSLGRHHHHQGDHHHHHQGGHHHLHQGGHHHYQQGGHISMNNFHFLGIYHSLLISREQPIYHCFTRVSFLIAPLQSAKGWECSRVIDQKALP